MNKLTISVDFDGVICSIRYPEIGVIRNGAKEALSLWKELGHTIIISSCRSGIREAEMEQWLNDNEIPYDYINENSKERIDKYGTDTRKISCDIGLDDLNAGGFKGWEWAKKEVAKLEKSKPLILCIIGESGSGKTTWADYIEREYGIPMIDSYTDRPKRSDDEIGHTFVTVEEFDLIPPIEMIAYTQFGNHRYCCIKKDVRQFNTYVIDETGLKYLKETFSDIYDIVSLRLVCTILERRARVGRDRTDRDKGAFTLRDSAFDFLLNTYQNKPDTQRDLNNILNQIF